MKKTAKILSIVLSISMVIGVSIALVFSAFAADAPTFELKEVSKTADEFVVDIVIAEGKVNNVDISFDLEGLTCTKITSTNPGGSMVMSNPAAPEGNSNISMIALNAVSAGSTIATATFKVDNAEKNSFSISIDACGITDDSNKTEDVAASAKVKNNGISFVPVTEAPTTTEPTTEAPTTTEPSTEAPTTTEPTTEAPTTTEPSTEAPTTTEPSTEAPTTTEPSTEAPTTTEPSTEAPTTTEPTTEAPTTTEPSTEAPTTTEPSTEAPTTTEPSTEAPTTEPTTEAPTTEPTTDESVAESTDVVDVSPAPIAPNPSTGDSIVAAVAAVAVLGISGAAVVALRKKED